MLPVASRRWVSALLLLIVLSVTPGAPLTAASLGRGPIDASSSTPGALEAGDKAVVKADGDCLRIRKVPGITAQQLTCLPEGAVVDVLAGRELVDGYNWLKVQSGTIVGWAAEIYLQPPGATSTPAPCSAATPTAPATPSPTQQPVSNSSDAITGEIPQGGGYSLVIWGGGTAEAIAASAEAGGCQLSSVWATSGDGALLVYIYGAPEVVNEAWTSTFVEGDVPEGTAVLIVCGGPTASALESSPLETPAVEAAPVEETSSAIDPATWTSVQMPLVAAPAYDAKAAVVIDGATGDVLHQKDAHVAVPPASLTKMVVAILAIEQGNLDAWVQTDVDSRQMPGSSLMGLLPGDCFRLRDLVYGLMLPSGNDAALAIARSVAGSDAAFVEQMNEFMTGLGLVDSNFVNPHGLDAAGHRASAYDLAMVARYGMTLPFFAQVVSTPQWTAQGSRTISLPNVNGFLSSYQGADGIKTGFTGAAGRTLVASAMRNGSRVFVTLLNAPNRYEDAAKLMDWAFAEAD